MFEGTKYLSFDCYGTLIDWEAGIVAALKPIFEREGIEVQADRLLEVYAELEAEAEAGPYKSYRDVLGDVVDGLARRFEFKATDADRRALARSVSAWPAFPDSREALHRLATRFRLVILSNVDDDLFEASAKKLGNPFHKVITAQQIGSYKPSTANFEHLIDQLGGEVATITHIAQSLYHDIQPARRLGLRTVWINRRKGLDGAGATPATVARPDLQFATLRELADFLV